MVVGALAVVAVVGAGIAWVATKRPAQETASAMPRDDKPAATAPVESKSAGTAPTEAKPDVYVAPVAPSTSETTVAPVDPALADRRATELLGSLPQPANQRMAPARPADELATSAEPTSPAPAPVPAQARKEVARAEAKATSPKTSAAEKGGKAESGKSASSAGRSAECAQIYQRLSLGETRPDLIERAKTLNCQ